MNLVGIYIDGDNISPQIIPSLLERSKKLGLIGLIKVYRDWSQVDSKKWAQMVQEYKIEAIQVFRQSKKQSTDIYMITDLLNDNYTLNHINHIVMATCDSDFTHLCHFIQRNGKKLIIIGKDISLKHLCYDFWYFNDLLPSTKKTKSKKYNNYEEEEINLSDNDFFVDINGNKLNNNVFFQELDDLSVSDSSPDEGQINNDLKKYLYEAMNKNYMLPISEFKKNLKQIIPSTITVNWRKVENELSKFPNDFIVLKKKNKINILLVPDLISKKYSKDEVKKILQTKYNNIVKEYDISFILDFLKY